MTNLANLKFNDRAGTFLTEFETLPNVFNASIGYTLFVISDGTSNNRLQTGAIPVTGVTYRQVSGGVASNAGNLTYNPATGGIRKLAFAYGLGANDNINYLSGTASTAATSSGLALASAYTDGLRIGTQPAAIGTPGYLNGWVRTFTYYPRRLDNNTLQGLTQ
jgi:hypothetical protein